MTDFAIDGTRRDIEVIASIGTVHGLSHFCQLVLPPLFPVIKESFGVGYTELGLMMTLFYIASGLSQTPAGFLIDRLGARRVLLGGLTLLAGSLALVGLMPSFWLVLPLVTLAGIGNSVFHPADYSILSQTVSQKRMARAYSIHALSGNLGWAMAPVVMLGLASLMSWRLAIVLAGGVGVAIALFLASQSGLLLDDRSPRAALRQHRGGGRGTGYRALLASPPILLCFGYFALFSVGLTGIQSFMPSALHILYGTSLEAAGAALTAYLIGGALGILIGGIIADRTARHERIVALGMLSAAGLISTIGFIALPAGLLMALTAAAGFSSGITSPSRDMLVRSATPPGSTGKVFGFVYSGLDLGSASAPPVLGICLDHGDPHLVFVLAAAALALAIGTAFGLRLSTTPRPAPLRGTAAE